MSTAQWPCADGPWEEVSGICPTTVSTNRAGWPSRRRSAHRRAEAPVVLVAVESASADGDEREDASGLLRESSMDMHIDGNLVVTQRLSPLLPAHGVLASIPAPLSHSYVASAVPALGGQHR
jgi:hypothetical protein